MHVVVVSDHYQVFSNKKRCFTTEHVNVTSVFDLTEEERSLDN